MFQPSTIKILKYLRSYNSPKTLSEIITATEESREHVEKALAKLVKEKMVRRRAGSFSFDGKQQRETLYGRMVEVCVLVTRSAQMELLIRGLMCATPQPCLIRLSAMTDIITAEGYYPVDSNGFIEEEIQKGRIKKIKLLFFGRKHQSLPTYVPQEYVTPLSWVDMDQYQLVGQQYMAENKGLPTAQEEYLSGNYPPELYNPAKEYLDRERPYIKDRLREEAMRNWFFWLL
ncbi:MAG: hypothetical protein U1D67_10065 [Dehalococcoidia bacterium]|nr:hypothetical protein [Dehalococcoidia bacterium]MDZ4247448.1 hypothetical protein [Dehalococcoidia bacterium]